MCIRVDANGWSSGNGTHISVFAYLMKGDNDDSLTWPFTGSITFELLNQLEDNNHEAITIGPLLLTCCSFPYKHRHLTTRFYGISISNDCFEIAQENTTTFRASLDLHQGPDLTET